MLEQTHRIDSAVPVAGRAAARNRHLSWQVWSTTIFIMVDILGQKNSGPIRPRSIPNLCPIQAKVRPVPASFRRARPGRPSALSESIGHIFRVYRPHRRRVYRTAGPERTVRRERRCKRPTRSRPPRSARLTHARARTRVRVHTHTRTHTHTHGRARRRHQRDLRLHRTGARRPRAAQ